MSEQSPVSAPPSSSPNQAVPDGYKVPFTFEQVQAAEEAALGSGRAARTALCISGGGIRSATFALGALQGLADLGILEKLDYVSTVSGGGYIGSWLTAWKQRLNGLKDVIPKLKSSASPVPPRQIDPIQHLREYNNYLSPKLGVFSADTWTLVATVARNMLLNWLVFIPLLMFGLMIPRIVLSFARVGEIYKEAYWPGVVRFIDFLDQYDVLALVSGLLFAIGIFNVLRYLPSVGNKDHTEPDFLKFCLAPLFLAAVAVLTMEAWFTGGDTRTHQLPTITFSQWFWGMIISGASGWLAYLLSHKAIWKKWKTIGGLTVALLLTASALAGAAWVLSQHFSDMSWSVYVTVALPLLLLAFALAVTLFVGFTSFVLTDEDREWLSRAGAWMLLTIVTWASFCALVLQAPIWAIGVGKEADSALAAAGGLSGCLAALAGLSSKTKARHNSGTQTREAGAAQQNGKKGKLLEIVGKLAAPLFILVFMVSLALLTNWILWQTGRVQARLDDQGISLRLGDHQAFLENTRTEDAVILTLIFLAFSWIMARYININKFSLQAMYRSRLIRAYLGASNKDSHTNPFTGFADNDNLVLSKLTPSLKPFHLVNITLNLVSGERLAWQQRKAESFTVSPLHCGYGESYRPVDEYAGSISLGTAVAISGAAASPNMGYHSSPTMAFVMTLFNARLGAWLGNPKQKKWRDEGPRSAFDSIVREAFGLTNDSSPYVYLSDGGHFENLGLYEMVRRRCRYILVLDGGADPKFNYEDLGNALRKIRIDMKITIRFEEPFLAPLQTPENRCAIAKICYKDLDPALENGYLIYIKPAVLGNEPPDVTGYKAANDDFPHQSTGDQWFDESQTESYRMLGLCSISDVLKTWNSSRGFEGLLEDARTYLDRIKAAPKAAAAGAAAAGSKR
ncbi:MAG TPA: patatin-like phospholipase family protein [Candidatus Angelobacter sp.]